MLVHSTVVTYLFDHHGSPFFRFHVCYRLRKRPAMAFWILRGVLSLAESVGRGRLQDVSATLLGVLVVPVWVFNMHHKDLAHFVRARRPKLGTVGRSEALTLTRRA